MNDRDYEKEIENLNKDATRLLEKYEEKTKEIKRLKEENLLLRASESMSKLQEDYGYKARIDKAINYITKQMKKYEGYDRDFEIVLSNIVVMLGSDKE